MYEYRDHLIDPVGGREPVGFIRARGWGGGHSESLVFWGRALEIPLVTCRVAPFISTKISVVGERSEDDDCK